MGRLPRRGLVQSVLSRVRLSTDRGSEFDNAAIDEMLEVFGIERSLSKKGCPFDNAVDLCDAWIYPHVSAEPQARALTPRDSCG